MNKKKVLIWGCGELGKLAFNTLGDNIYFIGFTSNNKNDKEKVIKYIELESIRHLNVDYILVASQFYDEIIKNIVQYGINQDKIINFYKIHNRNFKFINYIQTKQDYKTLVFGMSYSECAIYPKNIKSRTYNFSLSSQDIYFTNKTIRYLFNNNMCKSLKTIILELPYYFLNYDLSMTRNMDSCFNNYYFIFKDLHNKKNLNIDINELIKYKNIINEDKYNKKFIDYYCKDKKFEGEFIILK